MNKKVIARSLVGLAKKLMADGGKMVVGDAAGDYKNNEKQVRNLLKLIDKQVNKHSAQFQKHPENYGYSADLGHVLELLQEASDFLGMYR